MVESFHLAVALGGDRVRDWIPGERGLWSLVQAGSLGKHKQNAGSNKKFGEAVWDWRMASHAHLPMWTMLTSH